MLCFRLTLLAAASVAVFSETSLPGAVLQSAVDAAVARGDASLTVAAGRYVFGAASFSLRGARAFALLGSNSTLEFAPGFGVLIFNSSDTSLSSLTVTYNPPCFTQGTWLATNASTGAVDIALDAGWPAPDAPYFESGEIKLQFFDGGAAGKPRVPNQSGSCIVRVVGPTPGGPANAWRVAPAPGFGCGAAAPASGGPLLATISPRLNATKFEVPDFYRGQAWWVHASANVTTEDVVLLGSGNFAFTESLGGGGHTYRRVALARDPGRPGALLSSNTDGMHSFSVGAGPRIVDSALAFMGDDSLNFHNRIGVVLDVAGAAVRVVDVGDVPSPDGGAAAPARALAELVPGVHTLRFMAPSGALRGPAALVTDVAWVTDAAALAAARAVAAALPGVTVNPDAVGVWRFTFAAPPAGVAAGDFSNFDARSGAGGVVENCNFSDAYDGVMRLQTSGTTLRGNAWARTRAGLAMEFDPSWLEGAVSFGDIVIENNVFAAVGYPPATTLAQVISVGRGVTNVSEAGNTVTPASAGAPPPPPACTNLTGNWCCEETSVVQTGNALFSNASYGTGIGVIAGNFIGMNFTNAPELFQGTIDAACSVISWSTNGAVWTRVAKPWPGPATPPPAWVRSLSLYELNPRAFTSPAGAGDGSGSGTWAALSLRVPYLQALGVTGLWVAGSALAGSHFYGIWSTYATRDVQQLDPALGPAADFAAFVDAAHAAGIRVFLDVTTHGICNDSSLVAQHPSWFAGSSWGMVDYNYANSDFFAFWSAVWAGWVRDYHVDGFRLDIADEDGELAGFDAAALAGDVAIFGETRRYHFGQHDTTFSVDAWSDLVAQFAPSPCFETLQFSCHDSGWESGPGNYFTLRGSRAWIGYAGALGFQIPLFFSGEEYDEDPVVGLPDLAKDLYGGGGPGGWMYGSQRQWDQIAANASKAAMLADVSALFAMAAAHSDVIHRDRCSTAIVRVPVTAAAAAAADIVAVPYARFLAGTKAVLVFANADAAADAALTAAVPLAAMGLAGRGRYTVQDLYAGTAPVAVDEAALAALPVAVPRDRTPRGGLAVLLLLPEA